MTKNIAKIRIRKPEELVLACESLGNSWFRGQGSENWGLESTLERDANNFGVPRDALWDREQTMLRLFKKEPIYIYVISQPQKMILNGIL